MSCSGLKFEQKLFVIWEHRSWPERREGRDRERGRERGKERGSQRLMYHSSLYPQIYFL